MPIFFLSVQNKKEQHRPNGPEALIPEMSEGRLWDSSCFSSDPSGLNLKRSRWQLSLEPWIMDQEQSKLGLDWEKLVHRGVTVQLWAPHVQCALALLRPTHTSLPWPAPLAHTGPGFPTDFTGFTCPLTSLIHHMEHSQPLLSSCPLYTSVSTATLLGCSINVDITWVSVLGPHRVISPMPLVSTASSIICRPGFLP